MHVDGPHGRNFRDVARRVFDILPNSSMAECIGGPDERGPSTSSSAAEAAKLCVCMINDLTDPCRDRVVLANFARWASEDPPGDRGGMNFENTYVSVSPPCDSEPFACEHAPKSPSRNCYAFAPTSLSYRHSDASKRRMAKFLSTTLAGTDGFDIILSMFSLVAAGARAPEVMSTLVGPGGDGESLLLCPLRKSIWGSGHAEAPASMLQNEEEFRRQGHLYRDM